MTKPPNAIDSHPPVPVKKWGLARIAIENAAMNIPLVKPAKTTR
jgi:hypothetical protein